MRGVFFWEEGGLVLDKANPYGGLLAQAIRRFGVELEPGYPDTISHEWVHQNKGRIDVLHLNWPHYMYDRTEVGDHVARCAEVIDCLALARTLGYKIVWTVHNLYPHESSNRDLDHLARIALTSLADGLIVHCEKARELVRTHFHRTENVFVIPHGNFIEPYPNTVSKTEARRKLGLAEDHFVYFNFGNVRRYKGIERLVDVFASLPGDHLRLLLGAKYYTKYGQEVAASVSKADKRVILRTSRFFPNEDLQLLFNAADVGVFPFSQVLTSGSVITALSFGIPAIVPETGCVPEAVLPDAGLIYDPEDAGGLRRAMLEAQERDIPAWKRAARARAHELDWAQIAERTRHVYEYPERKRENA